jgi:hypothetical protein
MRQLLIALLVLLVPFSLVQADEETLPKGFKPLFNGKDLEGWQGGSTYDPAKITDEIQSKWDEEIKKHWQVKEDALVSDGHGPHLVTKAKYRNFELWVDWWLAPNGDSGLYLRDTPQVQIWDPANEAAHQHGSDKGSGGLWNNKRHERFPLEVADKPTREWNRMYVRMVGPYVLVKLNDKLVVDNVVLENYFNPDEPVLAEGRIHLQTHGSETRFRRVLLREIDKEESGDLLKKIEAGKQDN